MASLRIPGEVQRVQQEPILSKSSEQKYEKKYGFLKPVVEDVVNNYLDCGDLTKGFARIYCEDCKKSLLLPFSCIRLRPPGYAVTRGALVLPVMP